MNAQQLLVADAVRAAVVLTLAGLVVRRRVGQAWAFFAYLSAILVGNSLISFWPDRFFLLWFYVLKETVYGVLKISIAAELAYRVFRDFPGAARSSRVVLGPFILFVVVSILLFSGDPSARDAVVLLQPQMQTATIWLFTAVTLLAVWYNVPLHRFQRALLGGFTSYLIVAVTLMNLLRRAGFERARTLYSAMDGFAYLALMLFWAACAWRPPVTREVVGRRQEVAMGGALFARGTNRPNAIGCPRQA